MEVLIFFFQFFTILRQKAKDEALFHLFHLFQDELGDFLRWAKSNFSYSVNKIDCIRWPFKWKLINSNLRLLGKHILFYLFSIFSKIGSSAKHKLIGNYSQRKVINSKRMLFSTHDFWSHITRRSTGIIGVILTKLSWNTQISNS